MKQDTVRCLLVNAIDSLCIVLSGIENFSGKVAFIRKEFNVKSLEQVLIFINGILKDVNEFLMDLGILVNLFDISVEKKRKNVYMRIPIVMCQLLNNLYIKFIIKHVAKMSIIPPEFYANFLYDIWFPLFDLFNLLLIFELAEEDISLKIKNSL